MPGRHGRRELPSVIVDTYNAEQQASDGGFLGDRASNRAFVAMLDDWRTRVRRGAGGEDPLDDRVGENRPTKDIDRAEMDDLLQEADRDPEVAGLVFSSIEDFSQEFAAVARRFMRMDEWKGTQRIAVGGGFLEARVGLMAVGRVGVLLKAGGEPVRLSPVSRHPDKAALCGAAHLMSPEELHGFDAMLAVDIGGTNLRAGLVALEITAAPDLSKSHVMVAERWRHSEDTPDREAAVDHLAEMLKKLIGHAEDGGLRLAPCIGIGCPGVILPDGKIARGGQNLPGGNWDGDGDFSLPKVLEGILPEIGGRRPTVVMHNDAVVQGLSELPRMQDVSHWGVMTIGTGLGNARFSNRKTAEPTL
ncbi:hypothetical protein DFJ74DRAFT_712708 [Hyaloraphidium curvatum]|nr:hypothetical protein DFJ74DRAFT_712708 [Hyaloraphidium curvatum]